jgi:hypothetical protein
MNNVVEFLFWFYGLPAMVVLYFSHDPLLQLCGALFALAVTISAGEGMIKELRKWRATRKRP